MVIKFIIHSHIVLLILVEVVLVVIVMLLILRVTALVALDLIIEFLEYVLVALAYLVLIEHLLIVVLVVLGRARIIHQVIVNASLRILLLLTRVSPWYGLSIDVEVLILVLLCLISLITLIKDVSSLDPGVLQLVIGRRLVFYLSQPGGTREETAQLLSAVEILS